MVRAIYNEVLRLDDYLGEMDSVKTLSEIVPIPKELPLLDLCQDLKSMSQVIWNKQLDFIFSSEPLQITLDRKIVIEVFQNIISNAVRYADEKIIITCEIIDDYFYITIADDGKGFSSNALLHGAEPYFREEADDNEHFGLGLYICKVLCEKCGGNLMISSLPNIGAKVTAKFHII